MLAEASSNPLWNNAAGKGFVVFTQYSRKELIETNTLKLRLLAANEEQLYSWGINQWAGGTCLMEEEEETLISLSPLPSLHSTAQFDPHALMTAYVEGLLPTPIQTQQRHVIYMCTMYTTLM